MERRLWEERFLGGWRGKWTSVGMGTWLPWVFWLVGGTMVLQGAIIVVWALRHDKAEGRRRCPMCWYDMSGTTATAEETFVCPECGRKAVERRLLRTRRRWWKAVLGLLLLVIGQGVLFQAELRLEWWERLPTTVLMKKETIPYALDCQRTIDGSLILVRTSGTSTGLGKWLMGLLHFLNGSDTPSRTPPWSH